MDTGIHYKDVRETRVSQETRRSNVGLGRREQLRSSPNFPPSFDQLEKEPISAIGGSLWRRIELTQRRNQPGERRGLDRGLGGLLEGIVGVMVQSLLTQKRKQQGLWQYEQRRMWFSEEQKRQERDRKVGEQTLEERLAESLGSRAERLIAHRGLERTSHQLALDGGALFTSYPSQRSVISFDPGRIRQVQEQNRERQRLMQRMGMAN